MVLNRPGINMTRPGFEEKLYPAAKLAAVVDALLEEGVSPVYALEDTDSTFEELHSASTRISKNQLIRSYRNALALSRDPHLAHTIGSKVHLSAYGMYGYAMLCSTDFRRTMEFAVKYHQLATPLATISFEERARSGIWTVDPLPDPGIDSKLYRFVTEVQIATHLSLHRDIMGASFAPRQISVTYRPAADFGITEALVGCAVAYEQLGNQIIFDAAFLDGVPKLGNRTTYPSVVALCDDLLADLALRAGAAGRIRAILLENAANRPSLAAVAKVLKTPTRTLRRQLRQQDTTFRELSDELKSHVALRYLRDTKMTNEDIACALGYSDAANFRHAFRRWTNKSPHEFRRGSNGHRAH